MHVLGHRTQIHLVRAYEENYFRVLKDAGYHIAFFGKNDVFSEASFNFSVSEWKNTIGFDSGHNAFNFNQSGYYSMLSTGGNMLYNDTKNGDYAAIDAALEFLKNPVEPFVLFLPTRGAHPPYGAPRGFQDKITIEEVRNSVKLRPRNLVGKPKYHSSDVGIPHYRNLTYLDDGVFLEIQRSYLSMISYMDYNFGRLLDGLDSDSDLSSRTVVAMSSDHGDFGGDFGLVEKYPGAADDVLTRVPMILRAPNGARGKRIKTPVQTADILETFLDLAGVESDFVRFGISQKTQIMSSSSSTEEVDTNRYVYR